MAWSHDQNGTQRPSYDVAQICLNGHVLTEAVAASPALAAKHCTKCGEATVTQCAACSASIRGRYRIPGLTGLPHPFPPRYCHDCGSPYPWTERALEAAKEEAQELTGLTDEEKNLLAKSLDDVARDTPRTPAAANNVKRLLSKAGPAAAQLFRDVLVQVVSEAAKKRIWG